jgi:hypothetical protein
MLKKFSAIIVFVLCYSFLYTQASVQSIQIDPSAKRMANTYLSFLIENQGSEVPESAGHLFNPQLLNQNQTAWENQKIKDAFIRDIERAGEYVYPVEILQIKRKQKTIDINGAATKGEVVTLMIKMKNNSKTGSVQLFKITASGQFIIYRVGNL